MLTGRRRGAVLVAMLLTSAGTFAAKNDKKQHHDDAFMQGTPDESRVAQQVRHKLLMLPYYGVFDDLAFRVDVAHHYHRPTTSEAAQQNFIFDPATKEIRSLTEHETFALFPVSFALCRVYALDHTHDAELALAMDRLLHGEGSDKTNM